MNKALDLRIRGRQFESRYGQEFLCPPSKKEGHIALHMLVGMSVCRSVGMSVGRYVGIP